MSEQIQTTNTCMWIKDGFHFKFNGAHVSRLPTQLPTISILESIGLPTELPTDLPTVSIYVSSGQPNLHGKIPMDSPWAAHSTALWAAHFFIYGRSGHPNLFGKIPMGSPLRCLLSCPLFHILEALGCLLSCPLFPYMEVVDSSVDYPLNCPLFPYLKVVIFASQGADPLTSSHPWRI